MEFDQFETPFGPMALSEEDGALVRLYLPNSPTPRLMPRETPLLGEAKRQLLEYLVGQCTAFDLPLRPEGTPFQQRVWAALRDIPWGKTRTYQELALAAGSPRGSQAAGLACACNPLPLLIPCHRVLAKDGSLSGYAGGVWMKEALLRLEGVNF